jgi:hypothetical protein
MRVISQDGTIDVPYENFVFGITLDNYISAVMDTAVRPTEVVNGIMAKYSSREKALKVMELLRETYVGIPIVMQNVDVSEDVAKEFERLNKCGVMVRAENQPSKVDFINNAVFRFPADDEVKV